MVRRLPATIQVTTTAAVDGVLPCGDPAAITTLQRVSIGLVVRTDGNVSSVVATVSKESVVIAQVALEVAATVGVVDGHGSAVCDEKAMIRAIQVDPIAERRDGPATINSIDLQMQHD